MDLLGFSDSLYPVTKWHLNFDDVKLVVQYSVDVSESAFKLFVSRASWIGSDR